MWIKEKIYKNKFHIVDKCDIITQKNYIERESYMKKIFSLFLSIAMLATVGIVPMTANADVLYRVAMAGMNMPMPSLPVVFQKFLTRKLLKITTLR